MARVWLVCTHVVGEQCRVHSAITASSSLLLGTLLESLVYRRLPPQFVFGHLLRSFFALLCVWWWCGTVLVPHFALIDDCSVL